MAKAGPVRHGVKERAIGSPNVGGSGSSFFSRDPQKTKKDSDKAGSGKRQAFMMSESGMQYELTNWKG